MTPEEKESIVSLENRLTPLWKYIIQLYKVGGLPLVLVGIGGALPFMPWWETQKIIIASVALCCIGIIAWAASAYLAVYRWKVEMEIVARQDAQVIETICKIAAAEKSDVVKGKVQVLMDSLDNLGVRWLHRKSDAS